MQEQYINQTLYKVGKERLNVRLAKRSHKNGNFHKVQQKAQ